MERIKIATIDELDKKKQIFKKFLGKNYLIRKKDNSYVVFEYMCRHQGADLSLGKEENGVVTCPRHQWKYKIDSGENIKGDGRPIKQCPIEIKGRDIFIILSLCNQKEEY
ncbi:MAG: Rieske (2Fe-2S) protein [Candidatus Hydrogenedens sp.]